MAAGREPAAGTGALTLCRHVPPRRPGLLSILAPLSKLSCAHIWLLFFFQSSLEDIFFN